MSESIIISSPCGNCGHAESDHNGENGCTNDSKAYYGNYCACWKFVRPEDATPEMRANRMFPRMWNVIYTNPAPFVAGGPCMRDGCTTPVARRILVNIWGTVCEYEVCGPCGEQWHGKLVDDFPCKPWQ